MTLDSLERVGLPDEMLARILDVAAGSVGAPGNWAVVLEGSLAEGLGNDASDVDLLFVEQSDRRFPTMPTLLFVDGRRVEVRRRSRRQLEEQASEVIARAAQGSRGLQRLSEDLLNRVQRFSGARPLRHGADVVELQRIIPPDQLRDIVAAWFVHRARAAVHCMVAMLSFDDRASARGWGRTSIVLGTKAWLAGRGETYLERKWLTQQLGRVGDIAVAQRFRRIEEIWASEPRTGDADAAAIAGYLEYIGIPDCTVDPGRLIIRRSRKVTTWDIGHRVHLVKEQDVYVLGDDAGRLWRSIPFGRSLPAALKALAAAGGDGHDFLSETHRLGLISLHWQGAGEVHARGVSGVPPLACRPILDLSGGVIPAESGTGIHRIPLAAPDFAAAGMALVWSNVMVENAREDAIGALGRHQWGVLTVALRRLVRQLCIAVLSAYGVTPSPRPEEAYMLLSRTTGLPEACSQMAAEIERLGTVADQGEGQRMLELIDRLVAELRAGTGTSLFPASFAGKADWRETLAIGYDWVRLGAFLNARFPIEEAKDLLIGNARTSGGHTP